MEQIEEINATVKVKGLDEIEQKLEKIHALLKEAKTLANELASIGLELIIK